MPRTFSFIQTYLLCQVSGRHTTDIYTDVAVKQLTAAVAGTKAPFFMYMAYQVDILLLLHKRI